MPRVNTQSDSYEALCWDIVTNAHRYIPKSGDRVLDLGAHFGMFSLYCASRGCHVKAYEPHPDAFKELAHSAEVAKEIGLGDIEAKPFCVWSKGKVVQFWKSRNKGSAVGSTLPIPASEINPEIWLSTAVDLHTAMNDGETFDCVKVDIEGSEFEVFSSSSIEDLERIRFLTMEIHNDLLPLRQRQLLITRLCENFPHHDGIPVKVNGVPTSDLATLICWR